MRIGRGDLKTTNLAVIVDSKKDVPGFGFFENGKGHHLQEETAPLSQGVLPPNSDQAGSSEILPREDHQGIDSGGGYRLSQVFLHVRTG